MDTFISILRNVITVVMNSINSSLPGIVTAIVTAVVTTMIVGGPAKLWQKYREIFRTREIAPHSAATRLFSTLQTCRKENESLFKLNKVGTKIQLTLLDYENLSHSLSNVSQLFIDRYKNGKTVMDPYICRHYEPLVSRELTFH